jgi:hypothetical protein
MNSADARWAAQLRPAESIESYQSEAEHRHRKAARHVGPVRDVSHQLGKNGAAHDRHDDIGRRSLGAGAQSEDAQREDRRKHDGHEEIAQEDAGHGDPAQFEKHKQGCGHIRESVPRPLPPPPPCPCPPPLPWPRPPPPSGACALSAGRRPITRTAATDTCIQLIIRRVIVVLLFY